MASVQRHKSLLEMYIFIYVSYMLAIMLHKASGWTD